MSNWKEYRLKDVTTKIGSGATPTGGSGAYKSDGISLIRSQNVLDFSFTNAGLAFIDDQQANDLRNVTVLNGDVLLNITGDSVARVCKVPDNVLPARVNQHVAIIRADNEKAIDDFLLYYLLHIKPHLLSISEIGGTRRALTKGMIEELEVILPPLPEQKSIASILSSLDDKIDLLRRQNTTLEKMAETLFRQWFGEGNQSGEIENQIRLGDLIDTISISHKFPNKEVVFLNTSDIYLGNVLTHETTDVKSLPGQAKKTIKKGDILFSEIRPANGRWAYIDFNADNYVVSTKLMVLRPKEEENAAFLYFYITSKEIVTWLQMIAESRSGTFPQITFDQIRELKMTVPPPEVFSFVKLWCTTSLHKIKTNQTQIRTLTTLRDTLLPKLMSGGVKVG